MTEDRHCSFWSLVKRDLHRYVQTYALRGQGYNKRRLIIESFLFKPGFQAVFLYRVAHALHCRGWHRLAWGISRFNQFLTSAEIEYNARIGPGLMIAHPGGIVVGRGTRLGETVTLFQGVTLGARDWHPDRIKEFPDVGDNVFLFAGSKILGGIRLGNNVVVSANTVVMADVPEGDLAIGNPAQFVSGKGASLIASWQQQ